MRSSCSSPASSSSWPRQPPRSTRARRALDVSRRLGSSTVHDGETTTVTLLIENTSRHGVSRLVHRGRRELSRSGGLRGNPAEGEDGNGHLSGHLSAPRGVYRVGPTMGGSAIRSDWRRRASGPGRRTGSWSTPPSRSSRGSRLSGARIRPCRRPAPSTPTRWRRLPTRCVSTSKGDDLRRVHWPVVGEPMS